METEALVLTGERQVEIRGIDVPDIRDDEILVETVANGICMLEVSFFSGTERPRYPHLLGHEGIGRAAKVGGKVSKVKEGDFVVCRNWARHQVVNERNVLAFSKPPADPASTIVEPVSCVAGALYSYNIMSGDRVLVLGAGYMGLLNVIGLARCPIAELVVTDVKEHNLALARSYGATHTINTGTDAGREELQSLRSKPFDLVVECAGIQDTIDQATTLTRRGGRLGIFSWHHQPRTVNLGAWHGGGFTVVNSSPMINTDRSVSDMERAVRLIECGMFDQSQLVTHRHSYKDAQSAMELASERRDDYIKGVFLFDQA
ncbi:MAG: zinc-binding dehydrogenase [Proteobacteria bacterium]|nr:zinc-binding dehydrogenase [Pseudomonadota bacterium]